MKEQLQPHLSRWSFIPLRPVLGTVAAQKRPHAGHLNSESSLCAAVASRLKCREEFHDCVLLRQGNNQSPRHLKRSG